MHRSRLPHRRAVAAFVLAFACTGAAATPLVSDGSDGAFNPGPGTTVIDLAAVAPDGVFNFTTIDIPVGTTVRFSNNAANTPVFFGATGAVNIAGTIDVSASGRAGGPGGGSGGLRGINDSRIDGDPGTGVIPGTGGGGGIGATTFSELGRAGGGGGNATPGLTATSRTGSPPAPGGNIGAVTDPLIAGGAGGGGGGRGRFFGVDLTGGDGGGAGGAIQISTPGTMDISGTINTIGAHGGVAFANVFSFGGPGGGGSGGTIQLDADVLTLTDSAVIRATGGAGGGLSTETVAFDPFFFSSGANGGIGFLSVDANTANVAQGAVIDALPSGIVPAGFSPTNPFLPDNAGGGAAPWLFGDVIVRPTGFGSSIPMWFDPDLATGYTYEASRGRFASVLLPSGFGDDLFELQLVNPGTGLFETVANLASGIVLDLTALDPFGTLLSGGVDTLRILGIETGAGVLPDDPLGFPTAFTFLAGPGVGGSPGNSVSDGFEVSFSMTPVITSTDPGTGVPEPLTLALFGLGAGGLLLRRRRSVARRG